MNPIALAYVAAGVVAYLGYRAKALSLDGAIAAFTLALILHGMRAESLHFGLMASFHIYYQLYELYLARGGMVIPLKEELATWPRWTEEYAADVSPPGASGASAQEVGIRDPEAEHHYRGQPGQQPAQQQEGTHPPDLGRPPIDEVSDGNENRPQQGTGDEQKR